METKSSNPTIESAYIIYAQFIDIKNQDINQNLFTPYSYKNKNGYLYIESNKIGLLDDLEKIQIALLNQNYYDLPYYYQEL